MIDEEDLMLLLILSLAEDGVRKIAERRLGALVEGMEKAFSSMREERKTLSGDEDLGGMSLHMLWKKAADTAMHGGLISYGKGTMLEVKIGVRRDEAAKIVRTKIGSNAAQMKALGSLRDGLMRECADVIFER